MSPEEDSDRGSSSAEVDVDVPAKAARRFWPVDVEVAAVDEDVATRRTDAEAAVVGAAEAADAVDSLDESPKSLSKRDFQPPSELESVLESELSSASRVRASLTLVQSEPEVVVASAVSADVAVVAAVAMAVAAVAVRLGS